jgi:hypothetical protein
MHDPEVATMQLLTWLLGNIFQQESEIQLVSTRAAGVGYAAVQS